MGTILNLPLLRIETLNFLSLTILPAYTCYCLKSHWRWKSNSLHYPIMLITSTLHHATITFLSLSLSFCKIWLRLHDLSVSWYSCIIVKWSTVTITVFYVQRYLSALPSSKTQKHEAVIPREYGKFADVFRQAKAKGLPPHCTYDCVIDFLPRTQPPKGRVYLLSLQEHSGGIYPRGFLSIHSFFLCRKESRGMRPCIDSRGIYYMFIV